jgi:hypothetical protein
MYSRLRAEEVDGSKRDYKCRSHRDPTTLAYLSGGGESK